MSLQHHTGQSKFALLIVVVCIVERRFADEELRHIIVPELVEVVGANHDQNIRSGSGQRLAISCHLAHPLVCKIGSALWRGSAGTIEKGMVGSSEDSDKVCHIFLLQIQPALLAGIE